MLFDRIVTEEHPICKSVVLQLQKWGRDLICVRQTQTNPYWGASSDIATRTASKGNLIAEASGLSLLDVNHTSRENGIIALQKSRASLRLYLWKACWSLEPDWNSGQMPNLENDSIDKYLEDESLQMWTLSGTKYINISLYG